MAKQRNMAPQPQMTPERKVRILKCPMFAKTYDAYKRDSAIMDVFAEFLTAKRNDPMGRFGNKDRPFVAGDLKGYLHAGLSYDVSVVYTISGKNPHVLTLLGIFSHDELGTGNPPRNNLQKQAAKTFSKQLPLATPLSKIDESVSKGNSLLRELLSL